jgi:hypothetical protein
MRTIAATIRISIQTHLEDDEKLDRQKILYRFKKILSDNENLRELIRFEEVEPPKEGDTK